MVKIAVAGGTGNVATEFLRAPIRSGKHSITIFTRSGAPLTPVPGVLYKKVDYTNLPALTAALAGFDVCLSFLIAHLDADNTAQRNLIHASIAAGVRRFAPSEWGIRNNSGIAPYANKDFIANYLAELNREQTVLEYSLFQPSIFMDYFAHPHPQSPELITWPFFVDFATRRAIVLDDGTHPFVLTAISDDSEILARALDDPVPWPRVGGMRGCVTSTNELLALGRKIRGGEWSVEYVKSEDIRRGELRTQWVPQMDHPVIPLADREAWSKEFVVMFLKAMAEGAWMVGNEWNQRYPDYEFVGLEEYLVKAWEGRP